MQLIILLGFNLVLMLSFFLIGVYLFMQVDEKGKRHSLLLDSQVDIAELDAMLQSNRYEDALQRLMQVTEVDRFTAEKALKQLQGRQSCK